jgi:putative tricarboxylic transport membrane protein
MKKLSIRSVFCLLVLAGVFGASNVLAAANFPEKPVTLIVPYGAGGGSDIFARTMAAGFEKDKLLPKPLIVENKPGGSGGIGFAYVASKKKDPYFMVSAVTSFLTTPLMGRSPVNYRNFTPLANLVFDEYMLMVRADSKYKTIQDLVAAAKANPKKLTIGGSAVGGADSICTVLLEKATGIRLNYIVFNSGGEVNGALLGGHIDSMVANPGEALDLYKAGKVRILGVYAEKRLAGAPDVPTMKEQGIDAIYVQNRGFCAPADIPADARQVLEEALLKYAKTETFKNYVKENLLTEALMDGAAFGKFLDEWNARYAVLLTEMNLIKQKK